MNNLAICTQTRAVAAAVGISRVVVHCSAAVEISHAIVRRSAAVGPKSRRPLVWFNDIDSLGYVCDALSVDPESRCCPQKTGQYSCQGCNLISQCCNSYEFCVSCCLNPLQTQKELAVKVKIAKAANAGTYNSVFDFCAGRCRHNSESVVHENAYLSDFHHCFSLPSNTSGSSDTLMESRLAGISIVVGRQGESCNSVCKLSGKSCVPSRLLVLNQCEIMQKYMNCKGGCLASMGPDQPAEVSDGAPKQLDFSPRCGNGSPEWLVTFDFHQWLIEPGALGGFCLLSLGDFRQADDETRRLIIVLAGEAAVKRGYVFFSEVQFIPKDDLQAIDELWKKFSNNRFGYSVQRKIWLKVDKDFTRFFIKVGWMKKLDTEIEQFNYRAFPNEFLWELNVDNKAESNNTDSANNSNSNSNSNSNNDVAVPPEGHLPLTNALRGTQLLSCILSHPAFDDGEGDGSDKGEEEQGVVDESVKKKSRFAALRDKLFKPNYSF
uniref:GUN4-like domain-containing protein n=1 Tax=Chenopodium quinoa TaxID=63459 RepID=A0A803LM80_CHEQI